MTDSMTGDEQIGFGHAAAAIRCWQTNPRLRIGEIAAAIGVSDRQLRRIFDRYVGLSPKTYSRALQFLVAQTRLKTEPITIEDLSWDLELSSPARLYDLCVDFSSLTPGEIASRGKDLSFKYCRIKTLFGSALAIASSRGLTEFQFCQSEIEFETRLNAFRDHWPNSELTYDHEGCREILGPIIESPAEKPVAPRLKVFVRATRFQFHVWRALLDLKPGKTTHYGAIAEQISKPRSTRAVATAIGKNAVAMLIPCHRVLQKNGQISGYRWCPSRKATILAMEHALLEDR